MSKKSLGTCHRDVDLILVDPRKITRPYQKCIAMIHREKADIHLNIQVDAVNLFEIVSIKLNLQTQKIIPAELKTNWIK